MAAFGTPTVIGTITNATLQTSYTVPITATTSQSDSIVIVVGSNGTADTPTSVTDSQNQTYQMYNTSTVAGQILTYWQIFNSKVLTNTDTVTVVFSAANNHLKNIIVVDCPGVAPTPLALDQSAILSNSGTGSTSQSINTNSALNYELIIFAEQNNNTGGSPTGFSPFTNLSILHSGSAEYTSVSYRIVTTSGSLTAACSTPSNANWCVLTVGMFSAVPSYIEQFPFSAGIQSPSLAFNPATQFRVPPPQPPIPTVISSAPVNIQGAQSNIFKNIVNSLTGDSANFNGSTGTWSGGGNTTIAQTNTVSHSGTGAISLTSTAGGSLNSLSSTAARIGLNGMPVNPGDIVFSASWFLAAATPRSATAGIDFLDINGNTIGAASFGTGITDSTAVWQLATVTATAPAGAVWARVHNQLTGIAGGGEVHYNSDAILSDLTSGWLSVGATTGMNEQIQIFIPSVQQFQLQPDGIPYPLSVIAQTTNLPRQVPTATPNVFQPGAPGIVNVTSGGIITVFQTFAPQFPWLQILPGLNFNPSLNWVRQQSSTGNTAKVIDGGTAANVVVNAQFSDMATIVSVSATTNVTVTALSPPVIIVGKTATVTVTAPTPVVTDAVVGVTANVNIRASVGSLTDTIAGTVANVAVASTGQVATVTPVGLAAKVSVNAAAGNVNRSETGIVINVPVASTGQIATISSSGSTTNVVVAARSGTVVDSVPGVPGQVNVASSGISKVIEIGTTSTVTVSAPAGTITITKSISGVVANIAVATTANPQVSIPGPTTAITISAPAGSIPLNLSGPTATVIVKAQSGFAGQISITATLVNSDLREDLLLSEQGRLLDIGVSNILVSATPPVSSPSAGI